MPDTLNARDSRLVQWLNEAHAKESELEADLTAHIALTQKPSYKKRLQKHLTETRDHKRRVASRIKKLGGEATSGPSLPGVPDAVGEVAGKAVAAVKGQVGTARAAITTQPETHIRNAQEELREEHVEIALYSRIATLAEAVGDRETLQLVKAIRRDEEKMAKFLDAELGRLVKELVRKEIPRDQRATGTRRRRSTSGTRRASSTRSSSSASRSASSRSGSSRTSGSSRSTGSTSSRSRKTGSSSGSGSTSSRSRKTGTSSSRSRSTGSSSARSRSSSGSSASRSRSTSARSGSSSRSGGTRSGSTRSRSTRS